MVLRISIRNVYRMIPTVCILIFINYFTTCFAVSQTSAGLPEDIRTFIDSLEVFSESFDRQSGTYKNSISREEVHMMAKFYYRVNKEHYIEFWSHFSELREKQAIELRAGQRSLDEPLLRTDRIMLISLIRREYGQSVARSLDIPFFLNITVIDTIKSIYISEDNMKIPQTHMICRINDVVKGNEKIKIGDIITVTYTHGWIGYPNCDDERQFELGRSYFLAARATASTIRGYPRVLLSMFSDNNCGIYPIVEEAVNTPNDYFGIGEVTPWGTFKREFENKYMRPFEEDYSQDSGRLPEHIETFIAALHNVSKDFDFQEMDTKRDFSSDEIRELAKMYYHMMKENPAEFKNYLSAEYARSSNEVKSETRSAVSPSLTRSKIILTSLFRKEYGIEVTNSMDIPYYVRIIVVDTTKSIHLADNGMRIPRTHIICRIEDVVKGKNRWSIGDEIHITFSDHWMGHPFGNCNDNTFTIGNTYFLPVGVSVHHKRNLSELTLPIFPDDNCGIYPIKDESVYTPNDYFGVGEITSWSEFRQKFIERFILPFEEENRQKY